MNTKVGRIARQQSRLGDFAHSLSPKPPEDSSDSGDDESDDASGYPSDDEVTNSQWLALCHSWQKGELVLVLRK